MSRSCLAAGCTLCCHLVPVKEIGLRSFTRCTMVRTLPSWPIGCAIHHTPPRSCRAWSCVWLQNPEWDEALNPERCGVVFDENPDLVRIEGVEHPCLQAWVRPGTPEGFWHEQPVLAVVLAAFDRGLGVLFRLDPQTCCAVWRDANGDHRYSGPRKQQMWEPDGTRLPRAAALVRSLP
jgi:hypothetical protein